MSRYPLEQLKSIKYENNYLIEVVFRIDFSPIFQISEKKPSNFQESIRKEFPNFLDKTIIEVKSTFIENKKIDEENLFPEYNFVSENKKEVVKLTQKYLLILVKKYSDFNTYKKMVMDIYCTFQKIYQPIVINRLGLRYINKIVFEKGNPIEWNDYINPVLIHHIDFVENKKEISRVMTNLCLNKDYYNMLINFGISNPDYPSRVSKREYILDYDCYTTTCKENEVEEMIINFNNEIKTIFELSINDRLRKKMGVINEK